MRTERQRVSYRLSANTLALLEILAHNHDTTYTRVIEEAIREKAKREKIPLRSAAAPESEETATT